MRRLALTLPAPANRACLFAVHGGRLRDTRSVRFAIERRARNRSQDRKSHERSQFAQVVEFPQLFSEEALGMKNRNEDHLATSTGLMRRRRQASSSNKKSSMVEKPENSVKLGTDAMRVAKGGSAEIDARLVSDHHPPLNVDGFDAGGEPSFIVDQKVNHGRAT